jgi:hypothetical protein
MARKRIGPELPPPANGPLAEKLAQALKNDQSPEQPLVYEQELRPERYRITVVWDDWDRMPLDERTSVILRAYEVAEGGAYRERIALASGLTVPEATAAGMLPYQVSTALRKGDPVTRVQCQEAMLAEGASRLFGPDILQLRFATEEEAEACRQRLIKRLPQSENVWVVFKEIVVQDFITLRDSAEVTRS